MGPGTTSTVSPPPMTSSDAARAALIVLLQKAHAGELAAIHAYRGHAASVRDPAEKAEIREIEEQEADHRGRVFQILAALGAAPSPWRERVLLAVGRTIGLFCHVGGWYLPMYGAARLERSNIDEYVVAADLARTAGRPELVDDLLDMAQVEWDHEAYFRGKAERHFLHRFFPRWPVPPARDSYRGKRVRDVERELSAT